MLKQKERFLNFKKILESPEIRDILHQQIDDKMRWMYCEKYLNI